MKKLIPFIVWLVVCFSALSQPLPIMRNAMTTNVAGTPVLSQANLSVTNVGSATNWLFYGQAPNTVARLTDIIAAGINAATATGIIQGFGPNMFILITNGLGTNTTFHPSNQNSIALRANGPVVFSNDMRGQWAGLYTTGTNAGLYVDGGDGDINGSGTTSVADQTAIANWIALNTASDTYLTNPAAKARADIDGNGWVDFNDWALVQHAISGADLPDLRRRFQRSEGSIYGVDTNENFIIGTRQLVIGNRLSGAAKLEIINTNSSIPDFMVNTNQFWITNGIVKVDGSGEGRSTDPRVVILRTIDSGSGNAHAFSDSTTISGRSGIGYNSFDARILYTGANDYNHYASFQFSPIWGSSGWIENLYGMYSLPVITNGIVSNVYGIYLDNPIETAPGAVSNAYWLKITASLLGSLTNFAILQEGNVPNFFAGPMHHDGQTFMRGTVMIGTNTSPGKTLEIQRQSGNEAAIRIRQNGQNFWDLASPASSTRFAISDVSFATWGDYVTILNGGFFGLLTNNPQARLHVKGSAIIETNLAVKGSNYVAGQSYFANTVQIDGPGSGLEVDGLTVTNGITNLNANGSYSLGTNWFTNPNGPTPTNDTQLVPKSYVDSISAFGITYYLWVSSNHPSIGSYFSMQKSDVPLGPRTTNTVVNPADGTYAWSFATRNAAGLTFLKEGNYDVHWHGHRTAGAINLTAEIYRRTSGGTETEIATGAPIPISSTPDTAFTADLTITTNVTLDPTDFIVVKFKTSGKTGTPDVSIITEGNTASSLLVPVPSSAFIATINGYGTNTILHSPTLTNGVNYGNAFSSRGTNAGSEQFGQGSIAGSNYDLAIGYGNYVVAGAAIGIGTSLDIRGTNGIGIGFTAGVDPGASFGIAIGSPATSSHSNSVAIGAFSQTDKDNQIILGSPTHIVTVPNVFELPIGATLNYVWTCTNATTGRGEWRVGGGAGFSPSNAIPQTIFLLDGTNANIVPSGATHFNLTATNNFRLNIETNSAATDGQLITIRIIQDATGSRICTTVTNWAFGSDITAITLTTTPNKTDYIKAVYNSGIGRWDVVGFVRGY